MKKNLSVYYDEEGDFLELSIRDHREGYFKNLGKGIFEKVDAKTNQVTGIAIFGFKKRTEKLKPVEVSLPFKIAPL